MSNFYNTLKTQTSKQYGNRIQITADMQKYTFELIYRETDEGFHRTVTCFNNTNQIMKTKTTSQGMVGEFNQENIENQFDHFISEEWTSHTPNAH